MPNRRKSADGPMPENKNANDSVANQMEAGKNKLESADGLKTSAARIGRKAKNRRGSPTINLRRVDLFCAALFIRASEPR